VTLAGRIEFALFATTYFLTEAPLMLGAIIVSPMATIGSLRTAAFIEGARLETDSRHACGRRPNRTIAVPIKRFGLFARLAEETLFPTLSAAITSCLKSCKVVWAD
jgi:hypothetical protein